MSYKDLFRDGVKATLSLGMSTEGFVPYWLTQQEFDELYQEWLDDKEAERLKILTKTNDGFEISEADFKLRGSGDLFGTRQSGDMQFKLANLKRDFKMVVKAKEDSLEFMNKKDSKYNYIYDVLKQLDSLD